MTERAPVAAIVVSWNAAAWLDGCLSSLAALARAPAETLVVDNGSSDGSAELVRTRFPAVELLAAGDNLGFCRANNLGIARTRSPFVLLLNPDAKLDRGFLEVLLPAFDDPRVGMAGGKLLRWDGRTLDSAGQQLGRSRQPHDRGYGRRDDGRYDRDEEVFGVCGAAALYRRTMLESVADPGAGYFDEAFFAFGEDLDLAWRAQRLGWKAAYRHRALGYHARGATSGTTGPHRFTALRSRPPATRFHIVKNRYLCLLRNDSLGGYLRNLPFIWARDAATLGLLAASSPGVLARLWRERRLFAAAWRKRALDAGRPRHHVDGAGAVAS
ncbi:MAG TPA: glycosyltransferase family 2 protein [Candidatus Polarisedimenticolaceae bacterium]|nr:glycosyltransferase family 2 protein [Candidatus Polarisedimenticolaceae bacterium]